MNKKLLEYVYRKYGRKLYLYLYSLCKEHTLAEESISKLSEEMGKGRAVSGTARGNGILRKP